MTARRRSPFAGLTPAMTATLAELANFHVYLRNGAGVYAPAGGLAYVRDGKPTVEGAIAPATLVALAARGLAEQRFTAHSGHAFYRLTRRGRSLAARLARIEQARAAALARRQVEQDAAEVARSGALGRRASPVVVEQFGRLVTALATPSAPLPQRSA